MLKLVGFVVLWIIGVTVAVMVINTVRARRGSTLNDWTTTFFEGFVFGPVGILSAFGPRERATGRTTPRLLGGIVGCVAAYNLYQFV